MSARGVLAAGAAVALAALIAPPTSPVFAATQPTLTLAGSSSGGPGDPVSYRYTWDYVDCSKAKHPQRLVVVLLWDDSVNTPIGTPGNVTVIKPSECQGAVVGRVPTNASAGVHYPSAYLRDTGAPDQPMVPNSTAVAAPGQGFTVILPPTPTPAPTPTATPTATPAPTPTPTDTPLPADTPTAIPSESPTPTPSDVSAIPAGNARSSSPPGALVLVGIVGVLVIAAATAGGVLLARRRRPRPRPNQVNDDPFQFLR
jgi:hypothetical protein